MTRDLEYFEQRRELQERYVGRCRLEASGDGADRESASKDHAPTAGRLRGEFLRLVLAVLCFAGWTAAVWILRPGE